MIRIKVRGQHNNEVLPRGFLPLYICLSPDGIAYITLESKSSVADRHLPLSFVVALLPWAHHRSSLYRRWSPWVSAIVSGGRWIRLGFRPRSFSLKSRYQRSFPSANAPYYTIVRAGIKSPLFNPSLFALSWILVLASVGFEWPGRSRLSFALIW